MPKSHRELVDDRTINLSAVIYGGYVKNDRLTDIVYETYGNSSIESATELNVFIDLTSILHPLYSEKNRIVYNNITDVSAGIINMCAHYRQFFRQLSVNTRFYLINSLNTCSLNKKFEINYNSIFEAKTQVTRTKKLIDNNMILLKSLAPYLPGIYYIDSVDNYETAVIIANLIEVINDGNPNLIISRDTYPIQLTALYPYTSYLYPRKRNTPINGSFDTSWMLPINEKFNYRVQFWNAVADMKKINVEPLYEISPINYALFSAMTKCPERSLNRICTPIQARNFIRDIVGSEDIKVNTSQFINNPDFANKYPVAEIAARYNVMDVTFALPYYKASPEAKQIKFLDLDNAPEVNRIASKFYQNNPLELQKL